MGKSGILNNNIFYLWVIFGREWGSRLAILQEVGNEVCPVGFKLLRSTCNKSSIMWSLRAQTLEPDYLGSNPDSFIY